MSWLVWSGLGVYSLGACYVSFCMTLAVQGPDKRGLNVPWRAIPVVSLTWPFWTAWFALLTLLDLQEIEVKQH